MATAPDDETTAAPAPPRDLLGKTCFTLHIAIMLIIVAGWAIPARGALAFYLVFLPAMALHWRLNKNACVLNNIESWMRTRRWRDPENREEGQWLRTLVKDATGLQLTPAQMDAFTYSILAVLWGLGLWHLLG
ncbi:MAG: hypothetical protein WCA78_13755 [Rhizomicrobium sp.]|jgi:hypothetical protein